MPAGSVRALLACGVLGLSWLIVWRYGSLGQMLPLAFVYLLTLGVLIVAHFFAAHGSTIGPKTGSRSPLWLPGGTVRLLLVAGYLALIIFLFMRSFLDSQLQFATPSQGQWVLLVLLLLSCFFVGHLLTAFVRFFGGGILPYWFQDLQAWAALLALLLLGALTLLHVVINPTLDPGNRLDWPTIDAILAALVGFYFGARS
jgi:hypothetical protein